jgi:endo-1,4-beta-xylanase
MRSRSFGWLALSVWAGTSIGCETQAPAPAGGADPRATAPSMTTQATSSSASSAANSLASNGAPSSSTPGSMPTVSPPSESSASGATPSSSPTDLVAAGSAVIPVADVSSTSSEVPSLSADASMSTDASTSAEPTNPASTESGPPIDAGVRAECVNPPDLKAAGACAQRRIGVALTNRHLSEAEYANAALEFNYVTPEDEMKWDVTEPSRGTFTFTQGDAIVDFALENGMEVKGHTLVWHNQLPSWLNSITDPADLRAAMIEHIQGVMQHYRGKVVAWDVVNEAYEADGELRDSIWSRTLGYSFIEEAFIAAREADPDVKLYYNDYDIESDYLKTDGVYEMVADLKMRGIPIDGVGMQMHTRTRDEDPPVPEFIANIRRFVALGVEVVLSEMDVRFCEDGTQEKQSQRYHDIIAACVAEPGCGDITFWGISDPQSFLNARTDLECQGSGTPRPLLWDDNYNKKLSYNGVIDALVGR